MESLACLGPQFILSQKALGSLCKFVPPFPRDLLCILEISRGTSPAFLLIHPLSSFRASWTTHFITGRGFGMILLQDEKVRCSSHRQTEGQLGWLSTFAQWATCFKLALVSSSLHRQTGAHMVSIVTYGGTSWPIGTLNRATHVSCQVPCSHLSPGAGGSCWHTVRRPSFFLSLWDWWAESMRSVLQLATQ